MGCLDSIFYRRAGDKLRCVLDCREDKAPQDDAKNDRLEQQIAMTDTSFSLVIIVIVVIVININFAPGSLRHTKRHNNCQLNAACSIL